MCLEMIYRDIKGIFMFLLYVLLGIFIGGLIIIFLALTQTICCRRCEYLIDSITDLQIKYRELAKESSENLFHNEKKVEKLVDYYIQQFLVNFERELNTRKK